MPSPAGPIVMASPGSLAFHRFALICLQLGLLSVVLRQFQIESGAFLRVALLAFAGFAIHAFLPFRYRLPFFLCLSLAAIALVFGPIESAWLIGIGILLIVICHLPVSFKTRVVLLVTAGAVLAAQRSAWLPSPWSPAVFPILASMFMFRLIVYMYDLRHDSGPVSPWRTLSYFFLLPNVCFVLFPVVDFKTFRRNYYDDDAYRIYQIGVGWMVRGVIQLILYRFLYYYVAIAPTEVAGPGDLTRYILSNFLLYLRVSGQFHMIVGMLYLFGFRLPETHHLYLLSSSFTDFWRRINIYWKDFMLKVVYYPVYFRLKTLGQTKALVGATLGVFFATWLLHAYQWFWLRGSYLLAWPDIAFWGVLAALVVINALWETRYGRTRTLKKSAWTPGKIAGLALRTAGTFATIALLWSLWTAESIGAWLALLATAGERPTLRSALSSSFLVGVAIIAARGGPIGGVDAARAARFPRLQQSAATTLCMLVILALIGVPAIYLQFGPAAATMIQSLRSGMLNRVDTALLERGYYEDLMRVERFNSELWQVYIKKPVKLLDVEGAGLDRFTGDFIQKELMPSSASVTSRGLIRTNRWGMRDREYDKQPPPGTHRIALLGASSVMGWGVQDNETFENLLEDRLNRERGGHPHVKYEVLNFSVGGYEPLVQLMVLQKAFTFAPNAVYYVATGREASRAARYLAEVLRKRIEIPYPYLSDTAHKAGVDAHTEESTAVRRLRPFQNEILTWMYRVIVQECRDRSILPVLIFLPQVNDGKWREETPDILRAAEDAGFLVINLDDVYSNHDIALVRLAEWDNHPSAFGHRLVATRLYAELMARANQVFGHSGTAAAAR